ncbi:MAG: BlaI/MecI/CopY family transcriptional regulator [Oscillospiraceae bacterium]|nr:BlaI/MecI/CopY family transcriptional regulator [Oscillospiraceae bacterium]
MKQLFDSELKVMEPLWDDGPQTAAELVRRLADSCGWNKNTTYTVIKKLVDKKAIARSEPGFLCTPLIGREEVQRWEIDSLVTRLFNGSKSQFISALALDDQLSPEEARQLRALIAKLDGKEP